MHKDKLLLERKHVQDLLLNKPETEAQPRQSKSECQDIIFYWVIW